MSDHLPDTTSQPLELRIADETDAMRILEYLHDIEEPYKEVFMLRVFGELSFKKYQEFWENRKLGESDLSSG